MDKPRPHLIVLRGLHLGVPEILVGHPIETSKSSEDEEMTDDSFIDAARILCAVQDMLFHTTYPV